MSIDNFTNVVNSFSIKLYYIKISIEDVDGILTETRSQKLPFQGCVQTHKPKNYEIEKYDLKGFEGMIKIHSKQLLALKDLVVFNQEEYKIIAKSPLSGLYGFIKYIAINNIYDA